MTTKRQKLQAMADQTASPNEAEVAKAMLAKQPDRLTAIADDIKVEWGKGIEAQFAIGRLLSEAAAVFSDEQTKGKDGLFEETPFWHWVKEQDFPFSQQQGRRLRWAAENEQEVRAFIGATTSTRGPDMGVATAVEYMKRLPKPPVSFTMDEVSETHRTDSTFNGWKFAARKLLGVQVSDDDEATEVWPERPFEHLHVDDLVEVADLIKRLVAAYQTEKQARAASA